MTLEQLESFVAIVETGSFRAAGVRLSKAQSAVSYNIRTLEEQIGINLFSREKYRAHLTREGRAFLPKVRSLLRQCKQLSEIGSQFRSDIEPHFRLSVTALYDFKKFCKVLNDAKIQFPNTDFNLNVNILSGDDQLTQNQVDFAIADNPIQNSQLAQKELTPLKMSIVAAKKIKIPPKVSSISNSRLLEYPQIVVKSLSDTKSAGLIEEAKKWEVTDLHIKKELILAGLGWGRLPYHLISAELKSKQLQEIKIMGENVMAPISLVRRRGENHGRVSEFFWNALK